MAEKYSTFHEIIFSKCDSQFKPTHKFRLPISEYKNLHWFKNVTFLTDPRSDPVPEDALG